MINIKGVLFDMDGVLIDACELHKESLNMALIKNGYSPISESDHKSIYNGLPTRIKLKTLNSLGVVKQNDNENIFAAKQNILISIIEEKDLRIDHVENCLKELKSHNFKIGCFTNSIRTTAKIMLKKANLFNYLDAFVSNEDVVNPKPDPEGYIKCAKILGISPKNCVVIEDSEKGFISAVNSGCNIIKVNSPEDVRIENFRFLI